jgi:hypothetical protein
MSHRLTLRLVEDVGAKKGIREGVSLSHFAFHENLHFTIMMPV